VALGNLLFNIFITANAFILLRPILFLITDIIKIKDPLIVLVTFSNLINLLAIVLFLPILDLITSFLECFFKNTDGSTAAFINHASIAEPETALDLFRRETPYFIHNSMLFNLELFKNPNP
jgi:phosphate:Na+ symporter